MLSQKTRLTCLLPSASVLFLCPLVFSSRVMSASRPQASFQIVRHDLHNPCWSPYLPMHMRLQPRLHIPCLCPCVCPLYALYMSCVCVLLTHARRAGTFPPSTRQQLDMGSKVNPPPGAASYDASNRGACLVLSSIPAYILFLFRRPGSAGYPVIRLAAPEQTQADDVMRRFRSQGVSAATVAQSGSAEMARR